MLGDSWSSAPLLADLMLARMSRGDLYGQAWELSWRLRAGCLVVSLGFYPSCAPMQRAKLLAPSAERERPSAGDDDAPFVQGCCKLGSIVTAVTPTAGGDGITLGSSMV